MRGGGAGVGVKGNGIGIKAGVRAVTGRGDKGTGFRTTAGQLDVKELGGRFGEKERWRD